MRMVDLSTLIARVPKAPRFRRTDIAYLPMRRCGASAAILKCRRRCFACRRLGYRRVHQIRHTQLHALDAPWH